MYLGSGRRQETNRERTIRQLLVWSSRLLALQGLACSAIPGADPYPNWQPSELNEDTFRRSPQLQANILKINADPALQPALKYAAKVYWDVFGLLIAQADDGIPLFIDPELYYKGERQGGAAHFDRHCSFTTCNNPDYGVWIAVDGDQVAANTWSLNWIVLHELGHVISGWGRYAGIRSGHVAEEGGHQMAGVCGRETCPNMSQEDAALLCSSAQCLYQRLDKFHESDLIRYPDIAVAGPGLQAKAHRLLEPAAPLRCLDFDAAAGVRLREDGSPEPPEAG